MAKHLKFIDFTELSEDLKNFIQAGAKIFPVDTVESLPTQKDKDFYRVLGGTERNNIYAWDDATESYKLIGADDKNVYWDEIKSKPATYQPATHTHAEFHAHNNKSVIDAITSVLVDSWNNAVMHISDAVKHITSVERTLWNTVSNKVDKITGKGLSTNDFTDVDKTKLAELHTNASMDYTNMNNALQTHKTSADHDGRYYTKTEIDSSLSAKAPKSTVDGHIASSTIHVTQADKDAWNAKWDYDASTIQAVKVNNAVNADTTGGFTLGKSVPSNAVFTDTIYTHPVNHPPSIITQDASNRFVSDAEKATWNAKQNALGYTPENSSNKGVANGYAGLDAGGKVVASQLPSFVDDVLEYTAKANFPATGESGKIYVDLTTNIVYRWSGSAYVEISSSLALGTTSSTAYRGDYGNVAYTHSQASHAPSNAQKNSDITKAEIEAKLIGDISTHTHSTYVTQAQLGNAGYGDMMKAVYDTDGDGKVNSAVTADSVAWSGVTGKPVAVTTSTEGFMSATDKVKLDGIATSANNYVHPATHPPSIIVQDASNRFMTDAERTKLTGIATGANNYVHPTTDGNLHVPATSTTNNGKVLKAGATAGSLSWSSLTTADISNIGNVASINTNASTANFLRGDGTWVTPPNTTYSTMSVSEGTTGTVTTGRIITASDLKSIVTHYINTVPSNSTYPVLNTTEPSGLEANRIFFMEV